jgi:predicted PurR-regulated permease PerM
MARVRLILETIVGGYIRGQALTCALMASLTWILLTACRVPNALALAMFAGVADLLPPYVGAMLAVAPAALVASMQGLLMTAQTRTAATLVRSRLATSHGALARIEACP